MATRIDLERFYPPSAGTPFVSARVEAATLAAGPYTTRGDVVALSPVDTDPQHPQARSFQVDAAPGDAWFRVVFIDANGDESLPSSAVSAAGAAIVPTVAEVGAILRARTKVGEAELGTFTASTRPTTSQVEDFISQAVDDVASVVGETLPTPTLERQAKRLATLGAALLVELSLFPEQVADGRSPYAEYKVLYDQGLSRLAAAAISAGDPDVTPPDDGGTGTEAPPGWVGMVPIASSIGPYPAAPIVDLLP